MSDLTPDHLVEIAKQTAFVAAFLGGFAATFLGTVLPLNRSGKQSASLVVTLAISSCAFVVSVITLTSLIISQHPEVPEDVRLSVADRGQIVGGISFMIGIYALLVSIGLAGYVRSKLLGMVTSVVALIAALFVSWIVLL